MSRTLVGRFVALGAPIALVCLLALAKRGVGDPPAEKQSETAVPTIGPAETKAASGSSGESAVERALARRGSFNFDQTPLKDVLASIARDYRINMAVDSQALEDAAIPLDTPRTVSLKDLPLREALPLMLYGCDLNYIIPEGVDNVLLITTDAKVKEHRIARLYNAQEFSRPVNEFSANTGSDLDEIIEVVKAHVAPDSWDASEPPGTIFSFGQSLVVAQTAEVHERIAELLGMLSRARQQQQVSLGGEPIRAETSVQQAIRKQLSALVDFHFAGAPLKDVIEKVRRAGLEPQLDEVALADASITNDTKISFDAKQVPLGWALQQMLGEHEASYYVDHEVLLITTDAKAKERVVPVVYPVGDLIGALMRGPSMDIDGAYDELIAAIVGTASPSSWDSVGGECNVSE